MRNSLQAIIVDQPAFAVFSHTQNSVFLEFKKIILKYDVLYIILVLNQERKNSDAINLYSFISKM